MLRGFWYGVSFGVFGLVALSFLFGPEVPSLSGMPRRLRAR